MDELTEIYLEKLEDDNDENYGQQQPAADGIIADSDSDSEEEEDNDIDDDESAIGHDNRRLLTRYNRRLKLMSLLEQYDVFPRM